MFGEIVQKTENQEGEQSERRRRMDGKT